MTRKKIFSLIVLVLILLFIIYLILNLGAIASFVFSLTGLVAGLLITGLLIYLIIRMIKNLI